MFCFIHSFVARVWLAELAAYARIIPKQVAMSLHKSVILSCQIVDVVFQIQ